MEKRVFDLKDLDEEFWKKVVFFEIEEDSVWNSWPASITIVTEDKKEYWMYQCDLPNGWRHLHPMFSYSLESEDGEYHIRFKVEEEGWRAIKKQYHNGYLYIRDDLYDAYKKAVKDDKRIPITLAVAHALGADSLEEYIYINTQRRNEEWSKMREEKENNKFLPEHLKWKQMNDNNIKSNPIFGEYALLINRQEDRLVAMKFTIVYQPYHVKPMLIDTGKGTERYVLFEKTFYDFYGPIDYPACENKSIPSKYDMAFFDWACLGVGDMRDFGSFICSFSTADEAKEYACCYANANSHIAGDRNTMVTSLDLEEDHRRRVERYEAYQAYRKYYKEIMEVVVNYDGYPDAGSGGGGFLFDAILKEVPQITERQLRYFWHDVPRVLEKRTQDYIEEKKQKSLELLRDQKPDETD